MKNPKNTKKKKKNLICTLPLELLEEILLRLPVRSLLRFKCVCKSWLSLISDPQFAKSHFDLAAAPSYRLLRLSYRHKSLVCSIDIDASLNSSAVYCLPSPPRPPEFSVPDAECVGSCRGFVLLFYERGERTYLYLWNPSTASHKQLPGSFPKLIYLYNYGFGYDASTDDYFIFIVRMRRHHKLRDWTEEYNPTPRIELFSVKNNSWKFIDGLNLPYENIGHNRAAFPLNGALHWMVLSLDKNVPVIIAFDLMERTFSEIPLPHDLTVGSNCWVYNLRVMGGCLSLWRVETNEIWVMKEYKVQSSWTMSFVLHKRYFPVCTTKDGEIFGSSLIDQRLEKRNEKGKLLEHLSWGIPMGTSCVPTSIYRESLLSLPQVSLEETSEHGQW